MKKILLFLLLPLFSFSQDRGCSPVVDRIFSYSINSSAIHNSIFIQEPYPSTNFSVDTSIINLLIGDSITFYYHFYQNGMMFSGRPLEEFPIRKEGLILIGDTNYGNGGGGGVCPGSQVINSIYYSPKNSTQIILNYSDESPFINYRINWIEDKGDRNLNVKLNSSSSLNISTKKGNQTLRMFSMNGQLVYSYSFDAAEFADVNISLPENIFPSGIYILSLVSATEAQNFKVFVQ